MCHGTLLGYLGSLSQRGLPEIFSKWFLINLSNSLRHPAPLVDPLLTKNLDTTGPWCVQLLMAPRGGKHSPKVLVLERTLLYYYLHKSLTVADGPNNNHDLIANAAMFWKKTWSSRKVIFPFLLKCHHYTMQHSSHTHHQIESVDVSEHTHIWIPLLQKQC